MCDIYQRVTNVSFRSWRSPGSMRVRLLEFLRARLRLSTSPAHSLFQGGRGVLGWPQGHLAGLLTSSPECRRAGGGPQPVMCMQSVEAVSPEPLPLPEAAQGHSGSLTGVLGLSPCRELFVGFFCKFQISQLLPVEMFRKKSFPFLFFVKE